MQNSLIDDSNDHRLKKSKDEYKCGQPTCCKLYHSYTAFYNHCKKAHNGDFPLGSLLNDEPFDGPTKNRGRPKMKKNEAKNEFQIELMKAENELIEFLGTIRLGTSKPNEELISYVEDPEKRMSQVLEKVKAVVEKDKDSEFKEKTEGYLQILKTVNKIICENDLPEFYDPVDHEKYEDRVDSYNLKSIFSFYRRNRHMFSEECDAFKLLLCWLTRILSLKLLEETIFIILQKSLDRQQIREVDFFTNKSPRFLRLVDNYLKYIEVENSQQQQEGRK